MSFDTRAVHNVKVGKLTPRQVNKVAAQAEQVIRREATKFARDKRYERLDVNFQFPEPRDEPDQFNADGYFGLHRALKKRFGQTDDFVEVHLTRRLDLRMCYAMNGSK